MTEEEEVELNQKVHKEVSENKRLSEELKKKKDLLDSIQTLIRESFSSYSELEAFTQQRDFVNKTIEIRIRLTKIR